jgi:hypothetical protein
MFEAEVFARKAHLMNVQLELSDCSKRQMGGWNTKEGWLGTGRP